MTNLTPDAFNRLDARARDRFGHGVADCTWDELGQLLTETRAAQARTIAEYDQAEAELRESDR